MTSTCTGMTTGGQDGDRAAYATATKRRAVAPLPLREGPGARATVPTPSRGTRRPSMRRRWSASPSPLGCYPGSLPQACPSVQCTTPGSLRAPRPSRAGHSAVAPRGRSS